MLAVAGDVLQNHDGVVDDDADDQRQAQHGEAVDGEAAEVEDDEGAQDGGGDGQQDVQGRAPGAQKEQADQGGQHDRAHELGFQLVDRVLDELAGVEHGLDGHALGQSGLQLLDPLLDRVGHGHGVGAALFDDAHAHGELAFGAGEAADVVEAVFDGGDVLEAEHPVARAAAHPVGDDQVGELFRSVGLAVDPDVVFLGTVVDVACRDVGMLGGDAVEDVLDGDLALGHLVGVEPDPEVGVDVAAQVDVAHAGHHGQVVLEVLADVAGELGQGDLGARFGLEHQPDDGLVLGVDLLDDGRVDLRGQVALGLGDAALHVLHRGVDAAVEVELHGDPGLAHAGGGVDVLHALHAHDRVLDDVGDLGLHDLGGGVLPGHGDGDHGEVHVRQLADAHAVEADPAEDHESDHEHPREDRVLDGDVGEGQGAPRWRP